MRAADIRRSVALPLLLCAVAALPRLMLLNYVEFKGDEAEVAGTVRQMLETRHPVLTGMGTSVGPLNFPLFDYLMALPLSVSSDYRVATGFIGVMNVLAVLFTYLLARRLWGTGAACVAGLLFATAPWAVIFSRKIWAPDLEPFFAICCLTGLLLARRGNPAWAGVAIAAWLWMCQLHPGALLLAPVFLIAGPPFWQRLRCVPVLAGLAVGLAPALPFVLYDAAHRWVNLAGYFGAAGRGPTVDTWSILFAFMNVTSLDTLQLQGVPYTHFTSASGLFSLHSAIASVLLALALLVSVGACIGGWQRNVTTERRLCSGDLLVLFAWMWVPVLLTIRHTTPLYQHYFLILFPAPFLLVGYASASVGEWLCLCDRSAADDARVEYGAHGADRRIHQIDVRAPSAVADHRSSARGGGRRVKQVVVFASLAFSVTGWIALLASFFVYLPTERAIADVGFPYPVTARLAQLGRSTVGAGPLWIVAEGDVVPVLRYLLHDVHGPRDLPVGTVVLPPAGTSAGYVVDDANRPTVETLKGAGASVAGTIPFPRGSGQAIGLSWHDTMTSDSLTRGWISLPIQLANRVRFLAYQITRPSPALMRVGVAWMVERAGPDVTTSNLALYAHLVDATGKTLAQKDDMRYLSARWAPGETVVLWLDVPVEKVPNGQYELRSGMYARPSIQRVPAVDPSGVERDGEFSLGMVPIQR